MSKTYIGYIGGPNNFTVNMPVIMEVEIHKECGFTFKKWEFLHDDILPKKIGCRYHLENYMKKFNSSKEAMNWTKEMLKIRKKALKNEMDIIENLIAEKP
jgi:hypothetical protein